MFKSFQSTPLREGQLACDRVSSSPSAFQSTPLREGRRPQARWACPQNTFQSTPLREGRPDFLQQDFDKLLNFNPRPSVRGDKWVPSFNAPSEISIHAPP